MLKPFYRPVNPFEVNQYFGENSACVSLNGKNKVITCDGYNPPPGYKSLYGETGHKGLDLRAINGQPIYCSLEGVVDFIDTQPKSGLDVRIVSKIDGVKYLHIYEHLLGHNMMYVGKQVKTGDCIGWADNTGYSAGDHLHFELKKWVNAGWKSVDPAEMMNGTFALYANPTYIVLLEKLALAMEKLVDILRRK